MSPGIRRQRQRILRFGPKPRCLLSFLAKLPVRQLWARPAAVRVQAVLGPPCRDARFGRRWARPTVLPGSGGIGPAPLCYWVRAALGPPRRGARFGRHWARPAVLLGSGGVGPALPC